MRCEILRRAVRATDVLVLALRQDALRGTSGIQRGLIIMRKVFLDCGMREGDAIAAFLGDTTVGGGRYAKCLGCRADAAEYEFIGFESSDYKSWDRCRCRFYGIRFLGIEKLVWTHDGAVAFATDGDWEGCRVAQMLGQDVSHFVAGPATNLKVKHLPCLDFSKFLFTEFSPDDYIVVKMDIEGAEYDVLDEVIKTRAIEKIRELYVEYHSWGRTFLRSDIEIGLSRCSALHYRCDWP